MTPTKLLIGQILVVVAILIGGVWAATQWAAAMLAHQPELGPAWVEIIGLRIYRPWQLFIWWYFFDAYAPQVFDKAGSLAAASGFMGCGAAIVGSLWRARQVGQVTTYGSARWATPKEVRKAGLLGDHGVVLGQFGQSYLRHDGPEHVLTFAPTRSGKGVGLVVPTLLTWSGSAVIHDIKSENWKVTAGWRSQFSRCLKFDPTDPRSARYNPLLEIRCGSPDEVRDVQNIADILVDPEGSLDRRDHWQKTAHALLVGAILHVLYAEKDKSLARVSALLSDPERTSLETLELMLRTNHCGTPLKPRPHPVVAETAGELAKKSENELSGVLSTALSYLALYRDPTIAAVTSACDWRIADLLEGDHPVSLYLAVPPSDISRTRPLIRLLLNQIARRVTEQHANERRNGRQLLLMLDEFPALGRLDFFETSLAFMAGYGVRAFLVAQSLNQIVKAYGENNAILGNCHVRVAFAANDERTAKRISDALGTATEQRAMRNYAGHRLAPWLAHVMVSRQETSRPLLTPGEVMQLSPDEQIVLVSGVPPIRATKVRYHLAPSFKRRLRRAPGLFRGRFAHIPARKASAWEGRTAEVSPLLPRLKTEASKKAGGPLERSREHTLRAAKPKPKPQTPQLALGLDHDDAPAPTLAQGPSPSAAAFGVDVAAERDGDAPVPGIVP